MSIKVSPLLMKELEKANDWELIRGSNHVKVKISGRLAGIAPTRTDDASRRAVLNVISQVRAMRRKIEDERNKSFRQYQIAVW